MTLSKPSDYPDKSARRVVWALLLVGAFSAPGIAQEKPAPDKAPPVTPEQGSQMKIDLWVKDADALSATDRDALDKYLFDPDKSWILSRLQHRPRLMELYLRLEAALPGDWGRRLRTGDLSAINLPKPIILRLSAFESKARLNPAGQAVALTPIGDVIAADRGDSVTYNVRVSQMATGASGEGMSKLFACIRPKTRIVVVTRGKGSPRFASGPAVAEADAVWVDRFGKVRGKWSWTTDVVLSEK